MQSQTLCRILSYCPRISELYGHKYLFVVYGQVLLSSGGGHDLGSSNLHSDYLEVFVSLFGNCLIVSSTLPPKKGKKNFLQEKILYHSCWYGSTFLLLQYIMKIFPQRKRVSPKYSLNFLTKLSLTSLTHWKIDLYYDYLDHWNLSHYLFLVCFRCVSWMF